MKECPRCHLCFSDEVAVCPDHDEPTKSTFKFGPLIADRYRLAERLGQGSMSVVYRALDLQLRQPRAIKIIQPEFLGGDPNLARRLLQEATAVSAVSHPGVVTIIDSGILDDVVPFLVMDLISGPTLHELLFMSGALSSERAVLYTSSIGAPLGAAHKLGLLHGDLKPHNILIEKDKPLAQAVRILDFGLSKIKSGRLQESSASGMLRSPLYLAPEEWSDREPDCRSDIYSLAVMLYQMLAGRVPFTGKSIPAIMKQHLMSAPPPIDSQRGVPVTMETALRRALEKEPEKRPATVEDFLGELQQAIANERLQPVVQRISESAVADLHGVRASQRKILNGPEAFQSFDATVVIGTPTAPQLNKDIFEHEDASSTHEPVGDQTVLISGLPPSFDETMVLPATSSATSQQLIPASPSPPTNPSLRGMEDDGNEQRRPEDRPDTESEQVVSSISPALLVVGVILIILLIAASIIYTRMAL